MLGIDEILARVRADLETSRVACEGGVLPKREIGRLLASHPIVETRRVDHILDMAGNIAETILGRTETSFLPVLNPIGTSSASLPVVLPPAVFSLTPEGCVGRVVIDGLGLHSYWAPMQVSRIYPAPGVDPLDGLVDEFGRAIASLPPLPIVPLDGDSPTLNQDALRVHSAYIRARNMYDHFERGAISLEALRTLEGFPLLLQGPITQVRYNLSTNTWETTQRQLNEAVLQQMEDDRVRVDNRHDYRSQSIQSVRPVGTAIEPQPQTSMQVVQELYVRGLISRETLVRRGIDIPGSTPRPVLAGIDMGIEPDRTVMSFLRAGVPLTAQQALEEAILLTAWSEAYPGSAVPEDASQLTAPMRDRLLEGLNLLEDGGLDLSDFLEEVPFQIRAIMTENMPDALQAVRRLLAPQNEPSAEEPLSRDVDRTGTPYGLRDYLAKRPAYMAAWEKLNGPIAAIPNRFERLLEDD